MSSSTERHEQLAELYAAHAGQLRDIVRKHGSQNTQIVQDACAHAWAQLIAAEQISLQRPRRGVLAWLTTTANREAWRLQRDTTRVRATDHTTIDMLSAHPDDVAVDELVIARLRLDLVSQLPERPRRFLLRLALGYSYREIAVASTSATPRPTSRSRAPNACYATSKPLASRRAKTACRALEQERATMTRPCPSRRPATTCCSTARRCRVASRANPEQVGAGRLRR
jgi:DNA-directed RNA polymerase specialized sigma24 family protein